MERKLTHHEVVEDLVHQGRLTPLEAERIFSAPSFVLPPREVVSYLAALIIGVGSVRLVIAVFEDASRLSISAVLGVLCLALGFAAWRLASRPGALGRLSEVLEVASIGSAAGSAALAMSETDMRGEWIAIIIASVTLVWSLVRIGESRFVSALVLPVSLFVLAGTGTSLADIDESLTAGPIAFVGLLLVALGLTGVRQEVFFRAVGSVVLLWTLPAWASQRPGLEGILPAVAVAVGLFSLGVVRMWVEFIAPMALALTILVCAYVFEHVDNDVAQGVLVVAVGLSVLAGTGMAVRRARHNGNHRHDTHHPPRYRVGA